MNRRSFLMKLGVGMLSALVVRPSIDVTKLFQPTQRQLDFFYGGSAGGGKTETLAKIIEIEFNRVMPRVKELFNRDDFFYSAIKNRNMEVVSNRQMNVPIKLGAL